MNESDFQRMLMKLDELQNQDLEAVEVRLSRQLKRARIALAAGMVLAAALLAAGIGLDPEPLTVAGWSKSFIP